MRERHTQTYRRASPAERFEKYISPEPNTGCWLWTAACDRDGYGRLTVRGYSREAHRFSYELHFGKIPKDFGVLHHCDVRCCVNPGHLFLGTNVDNSRDRKQKGRNPDQRGEKSHRAKLSEKQVRVILADQRAQHKIAAKFSISQAAVSFIKTKKTWKHVP